MTIAAIHYYKLRKESAVKEAEYKMVDTATQKQPPLHTALGPSARQATATSQSSGQSAPADPEYEVVDNKQKQTSSSDILVAQNDAYVTTHFTAARQQWRRVLYFNIHLQYWNVCKPNTSSVYASSPL